MITLYIRYCKDLKLDCSHGTVALPHTCMVLDKKPSFVDSTLAFLNPRSYGRIVSLLLRLPWPQLSHWKVKLVFPCTVHLTTIGNAEHSYSY